MTRAVVVRPDGELADRWVQQCLAYVERHAYELVAIADSAGAMSMVAAGGADRVVVARESHLGRPPFVEIVADEALEPDSPRHRRPKRKRLTEGGQS